MKTYLLAFLLLLFSYAAMAQQPVEDDANEGEFYIGVGLGTVFYHIYYDDPKTREYVVKTGYFNPLSLNVIYKINERLRVRAGLGYGWSKDSYEWSPGSPDTLLYKAHSKTRVISIPVSGQHILFKAFKRFPVYGAGTIMPSFGTTKAERTETHHGVITSAEAKDTGMNVFATAGIGFNYKISKRLEGYLEYLFFKRNLTGKNSFHHDWDQFAPRSQRIYRSLAFGVNYRL